jgi:hypothetical protein
MAKRPALSEALSRSSGSVRKAQAAEQEAPETAAPGRDNPHARPGRQGKSNVTGYFPPEVKKQLRVIAAEEDKTIQQLLGEALNGLFSKYGKAEIAPTEKE